MVKNVRKHDELLKSYWDGLTTSSFQSEIQGLYFSVWRDNPSMRDLFQEMLEWIPTKTQIKC